ncbi:MAG: hypothetical protein GX033_05045 [Firmicutes bacterium]|nr:hypothetical protein [Bacillota bacterium]
MDFAEIEARAESDSQLRSLYGGYLLHKEQLRSAERDNATAFTDKLQVISDLKAIEGYMLNKKEGFKPPALEAAARFDEAVSEMNHPKRQLTTSYLTTLKHLTG